MLAEYENDPRTGTFLLFFFSFFLPSFLPSYLPFFSLLLPPLLLPPLPPPIRHQQLQPYLPSLPFILFFSCPPITAISFCRSFRSSVLSFSSSILSASLLPPILHNPSSLPSFLQNSFFLASKCPPLSYEILPSFKTLPSLPPSFLPSLPPSFPPSLHFFLPSLLPSLLLFQSKS